METTVYFYIAQQNSKWCEMCEKYFFQLWTKAREEEALGEKTSQVTL